MRNRWSYGRFYHTNNNFKIVLVCRVGLLIVDCTVLKKCFIERELKKAREMNKVVKNYIYNLSYQILVLIVPLITTPYVARALGVKGVGIFSYTNSIVQYFILFGCIGLNLYGQREVAYVENEKAKRDKVFWELVILRIITVSFSLLVYFFSLASHGEYSLIFLLMSFDVLASMIDISWFFQGIEDFKKIVVRNFIVKIIGVVLIFLFVKSSNDLYLYVICQSATLLLGNLSMWAYIPKLVGNIEVKKLNIKKHIKPTIVLFLPQIATSVYTVLDKTMIGLLTGIEEEVAYYEQGQKIVKIAMALVTSLGTVMMPRIANLFKQNQLEEVREQLLKSFRFVFFLSFPMMFGLMAISYNFVPWFFGSGYDKVAPNMMVISPILVIIALSNIMGTQYLLPIGRQKEYTLSVVVGCFVNFSMNLLLIPRFLSIGAAIATVIGESSVTGVQIYCTRKDFNFKQIIETNSHYIISSFFMFALINSLARYLRPSIVSTFICIMVGVSAYLCILTIMKDEVLMKIRIILESKIVK